MKSWWHPDKIHAQASHTTTILAFELTILLWLLRTKDAPLTFNLSRLQSHVNCGQFCIRGLSLAESLKFIDIYIHHRIRDYIRNQTCHPSEPTSWYMKQFAKANHDAMGCIGKYSAITLFIYRLKYELPPKSCQLGWSKWSVYTTSYSRFWSSVVNQETITHTLWSHPKGFPVHQTTRSPTHRSS